MYTRTNHFLYLWASLPQAEGKQLLRSLDLLEGKLLEDENVSSSDTLSTAVALLKVRFDHSHRPSYDDLSFLHERP